MLYLNYKFVKILNNQIIFAPFKNKKVIGEESKITVFFNNQYHIYHVQKATFDDNKMVFDIQKLIKKSDCHFNFPIENVLFANQDYIQFDHDVIEELFNLDLALSKTPISLNIKFKESQYIRFILIDLENNYFSEKYLSWDLWIQYENEFIAMKSSIDDSIKASNWNETRNCFQANREVLMKFLSKTGIDDIFKNENVISYRQFNILWSNESLYIPFELISPRLLVRYCVPAGEEQKKIQGNDMIMVYSQSLRNSGQEMLEIVECIQKNYNYECFSENHFHEYKQNFKTTSYFHFMGHGITEKKNGYLLINQQKTDNFLFANNLHFVFLNCCHVGMYSEGIINSFIQGGVDYLIASPYQIPDDPMNFYQSKGFYELLYPDTKLSKVSFFLYSLLYPYFNQIYRLFSKFSDQ